MIETFVMFCAAKAKLLFKRKEKFKGFSFSYVWIGEKWTLIRKNCISSG